MSILLSKCIWVTVELIFIPFFLLVSLRLPAVDNSRSVAETTRQQVLVLINLYLWHSCLGTFGALLFVIYPLTFKLLCYVGTDCIWRRNPKIGVNGIWEGRSLQPSVYVIRSYYLNTKHRAHYFFIFILVSVSTQDTAYLVVKLALSS